jgi:hypothetical protein
MTMVYMTMQRVYFSSQSSSITEGCVLGTTLVPLPAEQPISSRSANLQEQ